MMGEKPGKRDIPPPRGTQMLVDLQQIRALAHPLRLRILDALVREPRTTKQVADLLGERHTKLYHHVRELEQAKVIRLTETRPKRGTIERYYQATATQFKAAPSIFSSRAGTGGKPSVLETMLDALLESGRADVLAYLRTRGTQQQGGQKGLLAARLLIKGSRKKVLKVLYRQLSRSFNALWEKESKRLAHKGHKGAAKKDSKRTFALTIILCPKDEA